MDDRINYGNKAKNLEFVANHTDIKIPYFRELSLKDLGNINEILNNFSEEIMIRSNSSNEDLESSSNAGKYLSIGPISKEKIEDIKESWNQVLSSYEKDANQTVILQDYVKNAKSVSVLTSFKVGTDSLYRSFSIYNGPETDAVTSGKYNQIKNFYVHRLSLIHI